ncbi:MAG: ligase-associated DNA damage response exonuclease [Clostridia bacterium]|nr:ligase-associated DNA damage response exonuclease [Deltaproteobacteria bacterium]
MRGEKIRVGDVDVSFHPAGHVLGSSQIRVEHEGNVWVCSGDYKRDDDPTCAPFEVVPCDTFISEATFALPIYTWSSGADTARDILAWWDSNVTAGRASVLFCYALGKAQRILGELALQTDRPVYVHGAVEPLVEAYREAGINMLPTIKVSEVAKGASFKGELILAPPSANGSTWMRRFGDYETAFASGWMRVRGSRRRRGHDRGFVLSDHADWKGLLSTIADTGARRVLATHGFKDVLARTCREAGLEADVLQTEYDGETDGEEAEGT